jgi:glycosyltransferase involved in cell wall biosynthesis
VNRIEVNRILCRAWIVIAAYREANVIRGVVKGLKGICAAIVVVDDGSADATGAEALAGGATVLTHVVNLGQGAALQTGVDFALLEGADYVFTFDADGQHDPGSLAILADTMQASGADVVLGSRWLGKAQRIPALRKAVLRLAVAFTRQHSGLGVSDTHNGLRLLTRQAALRIRITQPRMAHASEILQQIGACKLRFAEAPVVVRYTEYSLAKGQKVSGLFKVLLDIFYARWTR